MEQQAQGAEEKPALLWATWKRGLFMVLFWVILRLTEFVIIAVGLAQFILKLSTGSTNQKVLAFGDSLTTFTRQMAAFLTYQTDEMPFPFGKWPESTIPDTVEEGGAEAGGSETAAKVEQAEEQPKEAAEKAAAEKSAALSEEETPAKETKEETKGSPAGKGKSAKEDQGTEEAGEGDEPTVQPPPPQGKESSSQTGATPG